MHGHKQKKKVIFKRAWNICLISRNYYCEQLLTKKQQPMSDCLDCLTFSYAI